MFTECLLCARYNYGHGIYRRTKQRLCVDGAFIPIGEKQSIGKAMSKEQIVINTMKKKKKDQKAVIGQRMMDRCDVGEGGPGRPADKERAERREL